MTDGANQMSAGATTMSAGAEQLSAATSQLPTDLTAQRFLAGVTQPYQGAQAKHREPRTFPQDFSLWKTAQSKPSRLQQESKL